MAWDPGAQLVVGTDGLFNDAGRGAVLRVARESDPERDRPDPPHVGRLAWRCADPGAWRSW